VDVGLDLPYVADFHLFPGRRHDLHDADGADMAARRLIDLRFLIALRRSPRGKPWHDFVLSRTASMAIVGGGIGGLAAPALKRRGSRDRAR
jgi:hypothetical protein